MIRNKVVWQGGMLKTPLFIERTAQKRRFDRLHTQLLNRRDVLFSCTSISEVFLITTFSTCQQFASLPSINHRQQGLPPSSHKNTLGCPDAAVSICVSRHLTHHLVRMVHLVLITHRINQSARCVCVHTHVFSKDGLLLGELGSKRDV